MQIMKYIISSVIQKNSTNIDGNKHQTELCIIILIYNIIIVRELLNDNYFQDQGMN